LAKLTCRRHWNPETISYCSTAPDIVWRILDMEGNTSPQARHSATKIERDIAPRRTRRARRKKLNVNTFRILGGLRALRGGVVFSLSIRQPDMDSQKNLRKPRKLSGMVIRRTSNRRCLLSEYQMFPPLDCGFLRTSEKHKGPNGLFHPS